MPEIRQFSRAPFSTSTLEQKVKNMNVFFFFLPGLAQRSHTRSGERLDVVS